MAHPSKVKGNKMRENKKKSWEYETYLYEDNLRPIDIIYMLPYISTDYIIGVCCYLEFLSHKYGEVFEEHYINHIYQGEFYERVSSSFDTFTEHGDIVDFYLNAFSALDEKFCFKGWSEEKIRKSYPEYDFAGSKDALIDSGVLSDFLTFKKMTGFSERFIFNKNIVKT